MKIIILTIFILTFSACSIQDPCLKMNEWNYTNEWYYKHGQRYQVYKTWRGKRFIYSYNTDSTAFKRIYIKTNQ